MVKYQSIVKQTQPITRKQERTIVRQEQGPSMYRQVRSDLDRRFKRR